MIPILALELFGEPLIALNYSMSRAVALRGALGTKQTFPCVTTHLFGAGLPVSDH